MPAEYKQMNVGGGLQRMTKKHYFPTQFQHVKIMRHLLIDQIISIFFLEANRYVKVTVKLRAYRQFLFQWKESVTVPQLERSADY